MSIAASIPTPYAMSIMLNEHKVYYQSVEQWIDDTCPSWVSDFDRQQAILTDLVWCASIYINTSVGHVDVAASSIDNLIEYLVENKTHYSKE